MKRRVWAKGNISPCGCFYSNSLRELGTVWEVTVKEDSWGTNLFELSNCKVITSNIPFADCSRQVQDNTLYYRQY